MNNTDVKITKIFKKVFVISVSAMFFTLLLPNLATHAMPAIKSILKIKHGAKIKCGDNLTATLDEKTGTLTIEGTGAIYNDMNCNWGDDTDIRRIVIKSSKKDNEISIGSGAFRNLENLTEVSMPDVTSIGDEAFAGCSKLKEISMPNVKSIGFSAFSNCHQLGIDDRVNMPNVVNICDMAFSNCLNLHDIKLSDNKVKSIGKCAFANCFKLTHITIPHSVTNIGESAFEGCVTLNYIRMSSDLFYTISRNKLRYGIKSNATVQCFGKCGDTLNWSLDDKGNLSIEGTGKMYDRSVGFWKSECVNTAVISESVTSIGSHAFEGCCNLLCIDIPKNVKSIGARAFASCSNLARINIPVGVKLIDSGTFEDCYNLSNIDIPGSVKSIGARAFVNCSKLSHIDIPNSVVDLSEDIFIGCANLKSIKWPYNIYYFICEKEQLELFGISEDINVYCSGKCGVNLTWTLVPGGELTISGNGKMSAYNEKTFWKPEDVKSVEIQDGITYISSWAFADCLNLKEVIIPKSVEKMGEDVFDGCVSLDWVKLPYVLYDTVTRYELLGIITQVCVYYVDDDGNTITRIDNVDDTIWSKVDLGGSSYWYGLNNSDGHIPTGSKFWIRCISRDVPEFEVYFEQLDKDLILDGSGNMWILITGITYPDGHEEFISVGDLSKK